MRRGIGVALMLVVALTLLAAGASANQPKSNPFQVAGASSTAETADAIATATATCPKTARPDPGPWRAISGGFQMKGVVPVFTTQGNPPLPPTGSGVVYESRKVGQRSWRVSAQSLWGTFTLKALVYCQDGVPKTTHASSTVATLGTPEIGPRTYAPCRSGKMVSGGFSTPPPFTAAGFNIVIASMPTKKGWKAKVLSDQAGSPTSYASSLTSYVYCAKRKRVRVRDSGLDSTNATVDGTLAYALTNPECPVGRFLPGGGGFSEAGLTTSQYLIPVESHPGGGRGWTANALKVGSGIPVTLRAHLVCG